MAQKTVDQAMREFVDNLSDVIGDFFDAIDEMVKTVNPAIASLTDAGKSVEEILWFRWEDESLSEWGDRLQRHGLLDDPDIRAEYQIEVCGAMLSPVTKVLRKWVLGKHG